MFISKALHRQRLLVAHFKSPNHSQYPVNTLFGAVERNLLTSLHCLTSQRFVSASAQFEEQGEVSTASDNSIESADVAGKHKMPYDVLFKEAVGLIEKSGDFWSRIEVGDSGNIELSRRLGELELELKELREKSGGIEPKLKGDSGRRRRRKVIGKTVENDEFNTKPNQLSSLYSLFGTNNSKKEMALEDASSDEMGGRRSGGIRKRVFGNERGKNDFFEEKKDVEKFCKDLNETEDLLVKELSPEMEVFVRHLYDEGYFKDANFLPGNRFDIKCFESVYAQDFVKFAAEKFGRDKQEIAKWLSGSDLKAIAVFGCASLEKRSVFAAKSLRTFFQIPENTVCSKCVLNKSCKFVNQSVWKKGSKTLNLPSLMRLLTAYALETAPPPLVLSGDIKACANRLMKDAINLSKTVPDAA